MKRAAVWVVAVVLSFAGAMSRAQEIVGRWQGTMHAQQRDTRTIVELAKTEAGAWSATIYFIDQSGHGTIATGVSFREGVLRYALTGLNGSFEGRPAADGKSIVSSWTQGPETTPLLLERAAGSAAWVIPEAPKLMAAMPSDAVPKYEVAPIRPGDPASTEAAHHSSGGSNGHIFTSRNTNMVYLITFAYGLQAKQIVGAPAWFEKQAFDIDAKILAEGQPNDQQIKRALQMLLEERFQLKYHMGEKRLEAYEIVLAKDGPKNLPKSGGFDGDPHNDHHTLSGPPGVMVARNSTLQDLGNILGRFVLDMPVINRTGINDRLDYSLYWTPDSSQYFGRVATQTPLTMSNGEAAPDLFAAIQQQLGLKLERAKGPVPVMVVESAAQPSAN